MGLCNWFVLFCTGLNMVRILKINFDIAIFFGLLIAGSRCYFQLFLCMCCDGIRSRRNLMYCMNITTCIEVIIYFIQWVVLIKDGTQVCATDPRIPTFGLNSCNKVQSIIFSANGVFIVIYMYFCCVTYEHYWRGMKNPVFLLREGKRIKKEQDDKVAKDAADLALAEERKKQLTEAALKQEAISAQKLAEEREMTLNSIGTDNEKSGYQPLLVDMSQTQPIYGDMNST